MLNFKIKEIIQFNIYCFDFT